MGQSDLVAQYNLYRKRGMELHNKLMGSCLDGDILLEAADQLGMVDKGVIIFKSEAESDILMEFALNDYREDGRSASERFKEKRGGEDEIENELLEGYVSAYTSLFKITSTSRENRTVNLEDVLHNGRQVQIRDNGLSMSHPRHTLLFLRIIPLKNFNMDSGIFFAFPEEAKSRMMRAYDNVYQRLQVDNDATRRFVAFFRVNRIFGKQGMFV